jgi:O-antigen/teichoic acid export membrane protein
VTKIASTPASSTGILRNAGFTLLARVVSMIVAALSFPTIARHLGNDWATFGAVMQTLDIFRTFGGLGLDVGSIRELSIARSAPNRILKVILALRLAGASLAYILLLVCAFVVPGWRERAHLLAIAGLGLFAQAASSVLQARFQSLHKMHWAAPAQVLASVSYFGVLMLLLSMRATLPSFLGAQVALDGFVFAFVFGTFALRRMWRNDAPPTTTYEAASTRAIAETLIKSGLPVLVLTLLVAGYSRLGIFILEGVGSRAVGQYYAAFVIAEILTQIGGAVAVSSVSVLSRQVASGVHEELRRTFVRYSAGSLVFSCIFAAALSWLGPYILHAFKPGFEDAAPILTVFAWASVFKFQNQLSSSVLYAFGKFYWGTACAAINLCVFLAAAFTLIPRYGAVGAAWATLITEGINSANQLFLVRKLVAEDRVTTRGTNP